VILLVDLPAAGDPLPVMVLTSQSSPHTFGAAQDAILGGVHTRRTRLAVAVACIAALAVAPSGCGTGARAGGRPLAATAPAVAVQPVDRLRHHPRAVDPAAGAIAGTAVVAADALPQPLTDAQIRRELAASGIPAGSQAMLTPAGLAVAPLDAPPAVQAVIAAGNQIARLPYRYGGGHRTWSDTAYDCSASISFAFAAAGLISAPMVSGDLATWGLPGPGRWITVFANGGHTFMYVAGLRFDTGGLRATGSRWQATPRETGGFAERHPPGL
jgi:cell wall-associated NlpC family hydrolase